MPFVFAILKTTMITLICFCTKRISRGVQLNAATAMDDCKRMFKKRIKIIQNSNVKWEQT